VGGWWIPTPSVPVKVTPIPSPWGGALGQQIKTAYKMMIGEPDDAILKEMPQFFDTLKNRLKARFPQPIPEDVEVFHMKCGGRVKPVWSYPYEASPLPNRLQCEKSTFEAPKKIGGCGGCWNENEIAKATDDELRRWVYPRDESEYKLIEQNTPLDEYGNKQPRAYYYLKKKE
jgi:hypothetical protein